MLEDYIAHGDALLDDMLYSGDELYHWKLGSIMSGHKWVERLGQPGHYIYKYADDLHEALTGDKHKAFYAKEAERHGVAAERAKRAGENTAAAAIIAKAMGKHDLAEKYHQTSLEKKQEYEKEERYAWAYQDAVSAIHNHPINKFRRSVDDFVGETRVKLYNLVVDGTKVLNKLLGRKEKPKKQKKGTVRNYPNRPHSRTPKYDDHMAYVKKGQKVNWWEGTGDATGQQIIDAAANRRRT